jgi:hypothetical protein
VQRPWLYQVVGYALLDFGGSLRITGVGFYLARQGVFVRWPLQQLLERLSGVPNVPIKDLRDSLFELLLTKLDYQ